VDREHTSPDPGPFKEHMMTITDQAEIDNGFDLESTLAARQAMAVQYDEHELKRQMKAQMDEAIKSDRMKPSEAMRLLDEYERGLKAYTYLSFPKDES
jgi:arginine decarboxylase-like protein